MKTNIYVVILFCLTIITNALGQERNVFSEIRQAKESEMVFKKFSSSFIAENSISNFSLDFVNPEEVYYISYNPIQVKDFSKAIELVIPQEKGVLNIELLSVPDAFYEYEIVTSSGEKHIANRDIKHYHGIIKDDPDSFVAISFYKEEVAGLISTANGDYTIALDKKSGKHLLYNNQNLKQKMNFICGTQEDTPIDYDPDILLRSAAGNISSHKYVRLYFETEYDIYETYGSVSDVELYVTRLFNQVAILYANENIWTSLSQIFIWDTSDPYTSLDKYTLLSQFQNYRTSINGDLGQLLTFRSIEGGVAAGYSGLCNSQTKNKLAVIETTYWIGNVPNYSWSVFAVTHEFGHLFGSRHTHSCVWNGNNTAIDGCEPTIGGCPRPGMPANGGTIMSYCYNQDVGINFNLGFGLQPGNVIRNSVKNASCLSWISILGASTSCLNQEFVVTINNLFANSAITWTSSFNISLISSSGNQATFKGTISGDGWVKADIGDSGDFILTKNVGIDSPHYADLNFDVWDESTGTILTPDHLPNYNILCTNNIYHIQLRQAVSGCTLSNYQWTVPDAWTVYYTSGDMISINTNSDPTGNVIVTATTCCGVNKQILSDYFGPHPNCSSYRYQVLSSETSSRIIMISPLVSEVIDSERRIKYSLYNQGNGVIVKSDVMPVSGTVLDLNTYPSGIYILRFEFDNNLHETHRILLK